MKEIRPKEDKAVSPIIATILLIAITVVLAATLVTILGGFTHGAGNTVEAAGVTTALSTNGTTVTASVSTSSQTITISQVSFTLTINGTAVFTGTLSDKKVTASYGSSTTYVLYITNTTTNFDGGAVFTFHVVNSSSTSSKKSDSLGTISNYELNLNYKGTQFYSSGTQTS